MFTGSSICQDRVYRKYECKFLDFMTIDIHYKKSKIIFNTEWDKGQDKGRNFRYCDLKKATSLQFPKQGLKYLHSYIYTAQQCKRSF